jgi:hypothetical protein
VGHSIVATVESYEHHVPSAIHDLGLEWHVIFNKGSVMALPSEVTKATGLAAALDELQIKPEQAVAVGDAEKDQAFLRACGLAVAVANALPSVKELASIVTTKPDGRGRRADRSAGRARVRLTAGFARHSSGPMTRSTSAPPAAAKQLETFIDKFEPKHRTLIRQARRALRARFPTAHELAYDNYNFFVIGYSPTERPSDAIVSLTAAANGVGLCFIRGATLRDPKKVLQGSGKQTRFIRLESVDVLARPEVEALIAAAIAQAKTALPKTGRGRLIIRSVSAKQRPRVRSRRPSTGGSTRR